MIIELNLSHKVVEELFRYGLIRDILLFIANNRAKEHTISCIAQSIGLQPNTGNLRKAVKVLIDAQLLLERKSGRGRFLRINPDVLLSPSDPFAQIPQVEYRNVSMKLVEKLKNLKGVTKIILFGGVARGTADRLSDIDLLVVAKNPVKINEAVSRIAHECRTGKLLNERYGVSIKVLAPLELEKPRGFVRDALIEGISLYGGD